MYLIATIAQVSILLIMAKKLSNLGFHLSFPFFLKKKLILFDLFFFYEAWEAGLDPDNHVAPYLTATSDAIGTTFLVLISYII